MIIGSDNLEKFDLWKNIDEVLENKVIVLRRGNTDIGKYLKNFNNDQFIIIDDFDFIDISSTKIRNDLKPEHVGEEVYQYIKKKNLY